MQAIQPPKFLKNRILTHLIFWLVYISFFGLLWGSYDGKFKEEFIVQLLILPVKLLLVYSTLYIFLPNLLIKKQIFSFLFFLILNMALAAFLMRLIAYYIVYPNYYPDALSCNECGFWMITKFVHYAVSLSAVLFLATSIKILKLWYKDQQATKSLEKEKLEAELKFLKGQIHPHFLFNTLNNLYALTLKKSDNAPEVVLKLSELMNYMLYDANASQVPLEKEIQYIKNYIALEKIRYGKRVEINFDIRGEVTGKNIAPMLILPFVENTFKHGVSQEMESVWISIDLQVSEDEMVLKVENSKSPESTLLSQKDYAKGIGLTNVKRRLELLYKNHYELKIFDEQDTYLIVLKLNLSKINNNLVLVNQNQIQKTKVHEVEMSYSR